jgi:serine protease inhibitor
MRQRSLNRRLSEIGLLLLLVAAISGCGGGANPTASMSSTGGSNSGGSNSGGSNSGGSASEPPAVVQAMDAGSPVNPAVVAADNTFGLSLFQNLNATAVGNVAISPISVAMALQILYNGSAGTTQSAMAQTLRLGALSTSDLNTDNAALMASLISADPQVQLIVANSLWMHLSDNPVLPSFTQTDQTYYGATLGDLSGAPANVNSWVDTETNGLITQMLPDGDYSGLVALIANTIYFKGQWTNGFDPGQTASAPFTLSDGTQVSSEMMHQSGSYAYLQGTNVQVLRLPYGQGRFSMLIVLPNSGADFNSFVAGITAESLSGWIAQLQTSPGTIALPRFTSAYGVSLPPALSALGMGIALCSSNSANFSDLAPGVCVSDVEHKTMVEVDETGTVAAAATTITVTPTVAMTGQFTMTMDHPFFYAIQDDQTGELLFIGTLANPG